ncbi:MAG TPA: serine hydrolase domain-containing protein [Chthoniobacterales bacterium]|nr:serine hydrolase domain-containing protein [Chthoniobacterales bacterium]
MKCKGLIGTIALMVFALPIFAQTGIPAGSMSQCDTQMQTFMANYQIPGATLAITKNGKLVYMRAFGTADQAGTEATQPYHLFRIASISKPITSVAIMRLIESGQLSLSDKPFGPGGILNADSYFANANITDTRVYNITIQNLLEHSAGWNRDLPMSPNPLPPYPYGFGASDPIDFPLHVTQTVGEPNPVSPRSLIKFLIQRGLDFTPGTAFSYSNVGFLVLGEVIEKKTGMTYENYVKQTIFAPLGIYDIRLGKNLLADKQEREGEYNSPFTTLSAYGTGKFVPWQYGGASVEAMDAHGGWIATPRDLLRLFAAFDGFPSRPDILSAPSLQTMTTPSANQASYAKGIQVNSAGFWWHAGALFGSYSWMVRNNNQVTWAVILNKRSDASGFENAVANLGFGNCVNSTTAFPTHDLFDVPTQKASAMNFSNITSNSMTVNWTNGNGNGRVLIMRAGGAPNRFPLDGTEYAAGQPVDLGDGNYVVYRGAGNNTTVSNLDGQTNYQFRLYEYKKNVNTGNYALYQLGNPASGSQSTAGTSPGNAQLLNIATRLRVQSGDKVLIGGFVITGNTPKKVIIRGIGPSLSGFFSDALADPTLELFQGSTTLQTNNDWKSDQQTEIEATGIPPGNDAESAIVRTLAPGAYTAVLKGNGGAEGVGVVEVYDLDQAADSKLANIASRGFVETDNGVMIGGLIVGPSSSAGNAKVVVRALGPSLANSGINGTLSDPTLDLVNASGTILRSNDDWKSSQQAEIEAAGLAPSIDAESALIQTVAPGNYTAIVRGKGNTTGVALVEVYNVQ